ncbi:Golgi to ER traffic protein 4 homolog [Lingula anatina]|uniref:Golgi to ER traffic protein 4 homolog n=1 Tax=Lingula anatina TaxID=7574 RepID=A0A1S3JQ19_LINAN|nr:Golgi to ER traffic protein 4 homolog [Lingula anatina]|eukprot:XP_013412251.1 Golgi to ER traffic protein 4 homolog [Lingula anatina]
MANCRGVERILKKLKDSVDSGKYYEAHQMYRTLYFRYNAQKKYAEAIDLLYSGAKLLLEHNQITSGSDLSLLLLETLNASDTERNDDTFEKIGILHKMIDPESPDRPTFVVKALKWSKGSNCESNSGHPALHKQFAVTLWQEKNYPEARYHFVHSNDGEGCAAMLVEYHITHGYPSEVDMFIAQAVLQYLCLKNKATATVTFYAYARQHPEVKKGPPYLLPLLNFLWFLLLAIEGGKLAFFTVLCEQYKLSLDRDPCYFQYLDRIGQQFFGIPPPKKNTQPGVFGNLLQSLFGEDEEEEEGFSSEVNLNSSTSGRASVMNSEDLD